MDIPEKGVAVIFAVVMAFIAFSVTDGQTALVNHKVVDTESDWTSAELSSNNVDFTDGFLQLAGSNTSGSFTSVNYDADGENITELVVNADLGANNSANATVQYKNSSGDIQSSETVELVDGSQDIELNSSYDQVNVKYDLARESGSDTTPKVDYYKVKQESSDTLALFLLKMVAALFALGVVAFLGS